MYEDMDNPGDSLVRRYQRWPGKHHFLFDGRVMLGGTPGGCAMSVGLIVLIVGSHSYFHATYFMPLVVILSVLLALNALYWLYRAASTEPGIVQRNTSGNVPAQPQGPDALDEVGQALKFCETCQLWRERRVKHCSECDACVHDFDHHCPWIGGCVGRRNYRYFVFFVVSVVVLAMYVAITGLVQVIGNARSVNRPFVDGFSASINQYPAVFGLTVFELILFLTLLSLLHYHIRLITSAMTTNEQVRGKFLRLPNPYDLGWKANMRRFLYSPTPASELGNMRAVIADV